jgi:hypothetical protein
LSANREPRGQVNITSARGGVKNVERFDLTRVYYLHMSAEKGISLAVALTFFGLLGCGTRPIVKHSPEDSTTTFQTEAWKRMTECSAQTERLAAKEEWRGNSEVIGWENHYSPKYERCYVRIQKQFALQPESSFYELYDAFETKFLILCGNSANAELVCRGSVEPARAEDCSKAVCQQYIDEHMNK